MRGKGPSGPARYGAGPEHGNPASADETRDLNGATEEARDQNGGSNGASNGGTMSRRRFLLWSGAAAGGLVVGGVAVGGCTDEDTDTETTETAETTPETDDREEAPATYGLTALTITEGETLQAMLDRLIPSDEFGPGAVEAGVVRYADRALAHRAPAQVDAFRHNLTRLDALAREQENGSFASLDDEAKDRLLSALQQDEPAGFLPSAAGFFGDVRELGLQGFFGDPFYGGNISNAGWELIGFPGIRLLTEPGDQELDPEQTEGRSSVYDYEMFGLSLGEEG
ncbi:MAG: hypothetical protein Kow00129_10670 [Thermoleophilia bacterium]